MVVKTLLQAAKGKKASALKFKLKEGWEKANYKISKEQSLAENLDAMANREASKLITEASQGVSLKFTKEGKPFVPKGSVPSKLTKAKGYSKFVAPGVAGHYLINKSEQSDEKSTLESDKEKLRKLAIESGHPKDFPSTDIDFERLSELSSTPKDFPATDYDFEVLMDYEYKPLSKDESETYDFFESSFVPHLEFEKIRNSKAYKLLKDNNQDTSELLGFKKEPKAGAIKLPNPHHDKYDEKSLMQMVSKDAHTVFEPLLDFIIETPKDFFLSLGVAGVNGVDVAVNLIPLIDKVFDYSGNIFSFQNLDPLDDKKVMEFAQDLDVKLDKTREWLKKFKKDDNFVSQLLGIMGQDAIYSVPIFNKLRDLGMPKYPAFFISGGIGGAIGLEDKIFGHESTFSMEFFSKEIQGFKNLVGILPNTPYDEIADEVVQALEYGTMSAFIPAVVQSLQFMKKNIPFYAEKSIKKNKRKSKTK